MRRGRARQQGMAVVSALIVVAIVAALTSGLFLRQASAIRQVENEQARIQARWLLLGGIDWARLLLRENARQEATVRRDQLWSTPVLDTRIEGDESGRAAVFSGGIHDEQGKYNLFNLARRGVVDQAQVEVMQRLLGMLGLPDTLAPQLAEQVALTQSRLPEEAQAAPGSLDVGSRAPQPRGIDDLAALLGVDAGGLQAMRRTMTLLPAATLVNVNTAEPEVIAALVPGLSLAQARSVLGERDRGRWFNDSGDFANRLAGGGEPLQVPAVATTSEWFLANGTVAYQRARVSMQALLGIAGQRAPQTIWIKETP
ncbi:type II secretion system minor pseudopilin GspK [Bordetella sp. BOR01]|uniref:type II secretion system minor pseudopilin GspK n=1 Tax=Bordetella sp. BOR01 TaxID=2854779 RepID=UPI001C440055|nr:type II secretion system minor pseudopilin GspK [Bordetella sp. BOR01]MBV7482798.1 type II secretion system minor pseudopilin GspK [Bordetella sp. BOR01]